MLIRISRLNGGHVADRVRVRRLCPPYGSAFPRGIVDGDLGTRSCAHVPRPQLSAKLSVFRPSQRKAKAVAQKGFLLIADITGYTMFLTSSELEHAQGVLDALFKSIFAEISAPIILSNLQGDAALAYLPDASVPQRQFPLDAIERIYCSFANTLAAMRLHTTCTCNACRNMGSLDLKFFLHHGEYAVQTLAGRSELQGPEVIRLHRLMKNTVTRTTGLKAYALVTRQAADAIGMPEFF